MVLRHQFPAVLPITPDDIRRVDRALRTIQRTRAFPLIFPPLADEVMKDASSKMRDMEDAPRNGEFFLAFCIETGRQGFDIARWTGLTHSDRTGYFQTSHGWPPAFWCDIKWPIEQPVFSSEGRVR